jgi:hypothetical protein
MSNGGRAFGRPHLWLRGAARADAKSHPSAEGAHGLVGAGVQLADVDGDRRADVCATTAHGLECALSDGHGFSSASRWSLPGDFEGDGPVRLADLNGDGRADACAATKGGVACAFSHGRGFTRASIWSPARVLDIHLADVSGDGRADLCVLDGESVACGMAP